MREDNNQQLVLLYLEVAFEPQVKIYDKLAKYMVL